MVMGYVFMKLRNSVLKILGSSYDEFHMNLEFLKTFGKILG